MTYLQEDKRNSITATATQSWFLYQHCFIPRHAFLPITAAPMLSSRFYQSLLLFSFVLHSFLLYHVGDELWYACYGFSARLGKCRASKGLFLFAWNVTKSIWSSWKLNVVIHHDWVTHPLFWLIPGEGGEGALFNNQNFVFPVMAGLIVEMLFMLVSIYNAVGWVANQWIWSILASGFSAN